MHIYGSRDNDLPPGTARPSQFRVDGPPFVSAFVKGMIGIEERDDNVHVKQDAHELHAFPVPQSLHVFQRDDFTSRGQNRYASPHRRSILSSPRRRRQTAPSQVRKDLPCRAAFALGEFLGGPQHIIVNLQSRPHASDVIASLHHGQMR